MIDLTQLCFRLASLSLRTCGWTAFAIGVTAEYAHLHAPAARWLDLVVFWALIAAGLTHLAAGITRRWAHG